MKKEIMLLLVIVSSAMVLSAAGRQDDDEVEQFNGRGASRGGMMGNYQSDDFDRDAFFAERQEQRDEYLKDLEVISINGPLVLVNDQLPMIENNGTEFYLMAPWIQVQDLELTNGMEISVEGYQMPGQPLQWDNAEKTLMVTKATVNGQEIEIDHEAGTYGMMGSRGGMKGNSARGGGRAANNGGMMGQRF